MSVNGFAVGDGFMGRKRTLFFASLGASIVLLCCLIGAGCNRSTVSDAPSALRAEDKAWLQQKARESGGELQRLGAEDQRRLISRYGKMARFVLRGAAQSEKDNF